MSGFLRGCLWAITFGIISRQTTEIAQDVTLDGETKASLQEARERHEEALERLSVVAEEGKAVAEEMTTAMTRGL